MLSAVGAAALALLVLAGCGDAPSSSGPTVPTAPGVGTPATTPSPPASPAPPVPPPADANEPNVPASPGATATAEATEPNANAPAEATEPALITATWGEHDGGRSLAVEPAQWVRNAEPIAFDALWDELVAAVPEADTPAMRDQLLCHMIGAPAKATWNLEPWRPDVGLIEVMRARCNP